MKKDKEIAEPCSPPQKKTGRKERQRNSRTNLQPPPKKRQEEKKDKETAEPICSKMKNRERESIQPQKVRFINSLMCTVQHPSADTLSQTS